MRVCIVGASGKLGKYMIRHALDREFEVVGVCRAQSVEKLKEFEGRITVIPGRTNDPDVIKRAVAGCDGVLTVLVPWGVDGYSSGTAQAVLDHAEPDARLIFSAGWHITRDGRDRYSWKLKWLVPLIGWFARLARIVDVSDQVEACRRVFSSDRRWTVVRGSDLEEGESQGLPVWSRHVGDPVLESNLTRRVDFALFMVHALTDEDLVQEAPAIVGCQSPSALAHLAGAMKEKGGRRRWSRWRIASWAAGALMLLLALVAKQFVGEVGWVDTLAQTGALIIGVGVAVELASRKTGKAAYRTAIGLALGSALLLGWVNGAVGIIGSENNRANLMYGGVILVGVVGSLLARFKPEGMARALFATALAQMLVAVIALVWRLGSPYSGPFEILTINGFFTALFVGSGVLFWKAARGRRDRAPS